MAIASLCALVLAFVTQSAMAATDVYCPTTKAEIKSKYKAADCCTDASCSVGVRLKPEWYDVIPGCNDGTKCCLQYFDYPPASDCSDDKKAYAMVFDLNGWWHYGESSSGVIVDGTVQSLCGMTKYNWIGKTTNWDATQICNWDGYPNQPSYWAVAPYNFHLKSWWNATFVRYQKDRHNGLTYPFRCYPDEALHDTIEMNGNTVTVHDVLNYKSTGGIHGTFHAQYGLSINKGATSGASVGVTGGEDLGVWRDPACSHRPKQATSNPWA